MTPLIPRRAGRRQRWLGAAVVAMMIAALGTMISAPDAVARPATQGTGTAAAAPAVAGAALAGGYRLTDTPLLLVHGWSDSCDAAFDTPDKVHPGSGATTALAYFTARGFADVRTVGYYSEAGQGPWSAVFSDGKKYSETDDDCTANVQDQASAGHCGGGGYRYTQDPIGHLSCLMAWYLYSQPKPVNIIAHSMGGLVVRGAMYFTTHNPPDGGYSWPPHALPVSRVITVATPHDGLQGAIAQLYNKVEPDPEVADMTVCPNYAATCTISTSLNSFVGGALTGAATSPFMQALRASGKPTGSVDTYWALMGSSISCDGPIPDRGLPSCIAELSPAMDRYTSSDFVVQADSQMAMPADAKIFYGDLVRANTDVGYTLYSSGPTSYSHEANTCALSLPQFIPGVTLPSVVCATDPYYLNDGRSGTTTAWTCTTGCDGGSLGGGITDLPFLGGQSSATTVPYSLTEMAHLLLDPTRAQVGHAAHAGNDYPYAGMGLFGQDEGVDGSTEFYGQCDSFAAWKVYENLGGLQRPTPGSLPAVGWQPSDQSISPVVGYAGQAGKAGTWGDAHDWIRSDQGLHAAPYDGVPFDSVPQPGAIAVWATTAENPTNGMPGVFGHVAYVTDVVDANTIQIEGYNMHGNGEWSTARVTRSGGGVDSAFGLSYAFSWPTSFVHLGDGPAGPVAALPASGNSYPAGTYGPTSASGGPSFTLTGTTVNLGDVDGWYVSRYHGVIGWQLYTITHTGAADSTATWNPTLPTPNGCYAVDAFVPDTWSNSAYAVYTVTDQRFGTSVVPVDENVLTNQYAHLGVFQADGSGHLPVRLTDQGGGAPHAYHQVAADGMRYVPTPCALARRGALLIDPQTPGFTSTDVWYSEPGHGARGAMLWTHTNGAGTLSTATYTPSLPAGCYRVNVNVPDYGSNSPAALYTVADAQFGATLADVDQADTTNDFVTLGVFKTRPDGTISVKLTDQNPIGYFVAADAVTFMPVACGLVTRSSEVIDPGSGSPAFTTAGATAGLGDTNGWYPSAGGGLRGNQRWTYANQTTPHSTATYSPSGLSTGCVDVRAFVADNHADNPRAGYSVAVTGPVSGNGLAFAEDQSVPTNAWIDLGQYNIPSGGHLTVTVNDTAPTNQGLLYTSADAIDFRASTGC
jgi:hypothetical protein